MTDQEFEQSLRLSYYREIATLDEAHNVVMVQHTETALVYVKKTLSLYNKDVYSQLMEHPVIGMPKIFDIIEVDNTLIVIEEYISGITLEKLLAEHGTLPEKQVRDYSVKLCDILTELHSFSSPIIHRDIKPSNVIITDDGRLVLVDLNGAKLAADGQIKDTVLIGTSGYAAPEQYGFGASNIQTDLFALGKLMTCLLTGSPDNTAQCPKDFRKIIDKCTQIDASKRYSSAQQLKNALTYDSASRYKRVLPFVIIACFALLIIIIMLITVNSADKTREDFDNNITLISDEKDFTITDNDNPIPSVNKVTDLQSTNTPTVSASPSPAPTVTPTPTAEPAPVLDELDFSNPIGVYEGNDKEKLVIADNGFAYYYCSSIEYTEVECPWIMTDTEITITLSVMHCDITANIKNGFEELIFKSKSLNWNSEVFNKISNDAASAILDPPPSAVSYVTVTHSGEKQFVVDGIEFTVPKQFRAGSLDDIQYLQMGQNTLGWNSVDEWDCPLLCFVDADAGESFFDEGFISNIFFYPLIDTDAKTALNDPKTAAINTTKNFLDKLQVNYTDTVNIAGRNCPLISINGLYNMGFGGLSDYIMTGYIVLLPIKDNTSIAVIQMLQRAGMKQDNSAIFEDILKTAVINRSD